MRHAVQGPLDFIAYLAALVPKLRVNLTRFHGVFAPNSALRQQKTPARRGRAATANARPPRSATPVGPEYSCSLRKIAMVKAMDGREFKNVAGFRCSYGTTVRRVAIQGLVCSPRMIVIGVSVPHMQFVPV